MEAKQIKMSTLAAGFSFKKKGGKDLTRDGIVKLCRMLGERFGEGNAFEPEASGSGFLLWRQWPGKDDSQSGYKCMRASGDPVWAVRWPHVKADVMTSWEGDDTVVIEDGKFSTCLRAFGSAPAWTLRELRIVKECLQECSDHRVYGMPKASRLNRVNLPSI